MELAKDSKTPQVYRKLEISEQTYYRWREEYNQIRLRRKRNHPIRLLVEDKPPCPTAKPNL